MTKQSKDKTLFVGMAIILVTGLAIGLVELHKISASNGANGTSVHGANGNSSNGADSASPQEPNGYTTPKSGIYFS